MLIVHSRYSGLVAVMGNYFFKAGYILFSSIKIECVFTKVYHFPQGRLCTLHPLPGSIDKRRHTNGHWDDSEGELNQKNNAEI